MYQTNEFRKGLKIEYEKSLWMIVECQHVKPGKGVAFVKTRLKNMLDQRTIDVNFRSGDKVGSPDVNEITMQVLYSDGESWHLMNTSTYDQIEVNIQDLGETALYLKDDILVATITQTLVTI